LGDQGVAFVGAGTGAHLVEQLAGLAEWRNPSDVPARTVLVVGGGNTGFQIAKELAATVRAEAPDARGFS